MNPTTITARISDQRLQLVNVPLIASGGVDVIQVRFEFCNLWEGCGKSAVFYRDEDHVYHIPIVGGLATVPHEVLADDGFFYFGVMGSADNIRTTEVVKVFVARGAITTATAVTEEPTPGIYEQIIAAVGLIDARLDEAIAMSGNPEIATMLTIDEDLCSGTITSNGTHAFIQLSVVAPVGPQYSNHYTDYCIPEAYLPLASFALTTSNPSFSVSVETGTDESAGWARVAVRPLEEGGNSEPWQFTAEAAYPLANIYISELGDIRVGYDGTTYDTAGNAVREQVKDAIEQAKRVAAGYDDTSISSESTWTSKNTLDKLCLPIDETGGAVSCYPVEDYPLDVNYVADNLLAIKPGFAYSDTVHGFTFSIHEDGSITVNGRPAERYIYPLLDGLPDGLQEGDALRLLGCPPGGGKDSYYLAANFGGLDLGDGVDFWVSSANVDNFYITLCIEAGTECDNLTFYPLLAKAENIATSVTQYGKNLLDDRNGAGDIVFYNASGAAQHKVGYMFPLPAGSYIISGTLKGDSSDCNISIGINDKDNKVGTVANYRFVYGGKAQNLTFSINEGDKFIVYCSKASTGKTEKESMDAFNIQVEAGNIASPYEPYIPAQSFPMGNNGVTVPALPGHNTLVADRGVINVRGAEDTRHTFEQLTAAIISLGGNV